jgi:exopolysaccharide biosynthesis polyprenyl glycosylphosphotransferase
MRYDLEHEQFVTPTPSQPTPEHDPLQSRQKDSPLPEGASKEHIHFQVSHGMSDPNAITPPSRANGMKSFFLQYRRSAIICLLTVMLGDSAVFGLLLVFVLLVLRFYPTLFTFQHQPIIWHPKVVIAGLALLSWSVAARITQAYNHRNLYNRLTSSFCALFSFCIMFVFLLVLGYPFATDEVTYLSILMFYIVTTVPVLCTWRVLFASIINLPLFRPHAVIIGADAVGERIAKELCNAQQYTANVLGYISVNPTEGEKRHKDGLPILGDQRTLRSLVQQGQVDMIIMAIDYRTNPDLFQEVIELLPLGIAVEPMTTAYERITGKIPVEHIGDQWYVALHPEVMISPLYVVWRKIFDLLFGLLGTVAVLLILPMLAPLIYFDSPGPIFYKQERLGRNGCKFIIYKFRSMHTNSESPGQAQWAKEGDARITRIGRFMRATHLDELPQAFNILRGDMSLIGPRPERHEFVTTLEKSIPFYHCRLSVKPGLTGWAQVKYDYGRSHRDALEKLQYDLYYIKHQSFILDIFIILRTFVEVLLHRGS